MRKIIYICLFMASWMIAGCSKHTFEEDIKAKKNVRIAVVLTDNTRERWDRIMNLAQKNISDATDICPVFQFYEENSHDLMNLAYDLAHNDSIISVIGCESETNTEILAYQMSRLKKKKPMFTFNTSQEVIRKYSTMNFMWGLCESDITQCEVILAQIVAKFPNSEVALLACNESYGQTFVDWFAFQATELGLKPVEIRRYSNKDEIKGQITEIKELEIPVLCVPSTYEEAIEMLLHGPIGMTYFSHKGINSKVLSYMQENHPDHYYIMKGITLVPDPGSGFQKIYEIDYNETPLFGEAQLYDAIMVTCLAKALSDKTGISVNSAVSTLLREKTEGQGNWTKTGIEQAYREIIEDGIIPKINGATGKLRFIPDKHSIIQYSTYAFLYTSNHKFYCTDYICRDEGAHTSSIEGAWSWDKIFIHYEDLMEDIEYPDLTGIQPIIVATSRGWKNYRHQADALEFYQFFKKNGFSDDEIILIIADDMAYHEDNPYQGEIFRSENGENLYKDIVIDYKLGDLRPKDFRDILLGNSSERLPVVVNGTEGKNVVLFWSGHGRPEALVWDQNEAFLTGKFMSETIREMHDQGKYRKFLAIIEACYSGNIGLSCEGIPGLLLMTAANDMETSKAEYFSIEMNTYLTNSFTSSIINSLEKGTITLHELYHDTYKMTMGSHVSLYNSEHFGNISNNYTYEFTEGSLNDL